MKMYLSSYRLGDYANELKELVGKPQAKVAVSVNALDYIDSTARNDIVQRELEDMKDLGFVPEELDLRDYFGKQDDLLEKMKTYDLVWFSGGNVFLLMKAFRQSGFDDVMRQFVKTDKLVYAGYGAAFCVLTASLRGVELVDDPKVTSPGYNAETIWEGLGLIDFYPIVHFRSNHHESELVEKEYEHVKAKGIPYKTFRDGDVYIVDGSRQEVMAHD